MTQRSTAMAARQTLRNQKMATGDVGVFSWATRAPPRHGRAPIAIATRMRASKTEHTKPRVCIGGTIARELDVAPTSVRARLCRHPELFPIPRYRRDGGHPWRLRADGDGREDTRDADNLG